MAAATAPATDNPPKKRSIVKLLLIVVIALAALGGGGFFALTKFGILGGQAPENAVVEAAPAASNPQQPAKAAASAAPAANPCASKVEVKDLKIIALPAFIVNLSGDNAQRYLRVVVNVEIAQSLEETLTKRMAEVRNRLLFLLTGKTHAEIGDMQGKYTLQSEIQQHVNEVIGGNAVHKVFFTEFIIQ